MSAKRTAVSLGAATFLLWSMSATAVAAKPGTNEVDGRDFCEDIHEFIG